MVHGELGAQNIIVFFLLYAITNWLLGEYRNVSEGEGKGMITSDRLFSLTKIMLQVKIMRVTGMTGEALFHICTWKDAWNTKVVVYAFLVELGSEESHVKHISLCCLTGVSRRPPCAELTELRAWLVFSLHLDPGI